MAKAKEPKEKKAPKLTKRLIDVLAPGEARFLAIRVMGLPTTAAYGTDAKHLPTWILDNQDKLKEGDLDSLPRERLRPGIFEFITGIQCSLVDGIPMPTWPPGDDYLPDETEEIPAVTYEERPPWHMEDVEDADPDDDLEEGVDDEDDEDDEAPAVETPKQVTTEKPMTEPKKFTLTKTNLGPKGATKPEEKVEAVPEVVVAPPAVAAEDVEALKASLAEAHEKLDVLTAAMQAQAESAAQLANGLLLLINLTGILGKDEKGADQRALELSDLPKPEDY